MQNSRNLTVIAFVSMVLLLLVGCSTASANPETIGEEAPGGISQGHTPTVLAITASATSIPSLTPISVPTETVMPTNTATPEPTITLSPTITPRPQPTEPIVTAAEQRSLNAQATATAVAEIAGQYADVNALPPRVVLAMPHEYQRLNNCAPTTTSMVMRFYGFDVVQADLAALQKPVSGDVNVTAEEVAASIQEIGLKTYVGHNGTPELMSRLLAAGFPIITEEWINHDGGMGHFRAIRGYDRERQQILFNDSFYGPDQWRSYEAFMRDWEPYNNKFVLPYPEEQEALVRAIIGQDWEETADYERLFNFSSATAQAEPANGYAWWGKGEALVRLGRPEEAIIAFETALDTGTLPWRYLWYRYGYFEALNQVGRYEDLLTLSRTPLDQMKRSEDIRYHRAVAFLALGRTDEAIRSLELALQDNPRFIPAQVMLYEIGS